MSPILVPRLQYEGDFLDGHCPPQWTDVIGRSLILKKDGPVLPRVLTSTSPRAHDGLTYLQLKNLCVSVLDRMVTKHHSS